tara:strand:+ start:84 stop:593 length:510 start_codon:yes stop_codon:yes gene_type:complete
MEGYIHSVSGAIREFFHLIGDQGSFVVLEGSSGGSGTCIPSTFLTTLFCQTDLILSALPAILAVPTEDRNKPLLKCLPAICANGCLEPWAVDSLLANVIPACYPLAGESKSESVKDFCSKFLQAYLDTLCLSDLKRKANLHLKRLLKRNKGALESTILEGKGQRLTEIE